MDLEQLIERLCREISTHLQATAELPTTLIIARRSDPACASLPTELLGQGQLAFIDDTGQAPSFLRHILPQLSLGQQADLARGTATDSYGQAVLQAILAGQKVEVIDYAYTAYRQTAPAALYRLYESQARQLQDFGIHPYQKMQTAAAIAQTRGTMRIKKLYTEQDIRDLVARGVTSLQLDQSCRLTPLAEDCARQNHLLLQRH